MAEKEWDISGVRAGPWAEAAGAPFRVTLDPLPFGDPFIAAAWGFTKKGEFERKYYWRAGRKHGPAKDLEDGKVQADVSLREQGVILPAGPAFRTTRASSRRAPRAPISSGACRGPVDDAHRREGRV
jgi:hypothetical protein